METLMKYFYAGLICCVMLGCGNPVANVSGTVSYKGVPLDHGAVIFISKDKMSVSTSEITTDGHYRLIRPLPLGEYNVAVVPPELTPEQVDGLVPKPKWDIPAPFGSPENTPIVKTVQSGQNTIDLAIE